MTTPPPAHAPYPAPRSGASSALQGAEFEQLIEVETPEQVTFTYVIAGVGSRMAAGLIDLGIVVLPMLALFYLVGSWLDTAVGSQSESSVGYWVLALFVLAQFGALWGYHVLFEGLNDGQTPGKRQLGLRVVQDGGYSVTFASSALRNLARIVDMQPVLAYAVGIVAIVASKSGKRLGDILAGTIVVQERAIRAAAPATASPATVAASATLTDGEYALLERFLARAPSIAPARRAPLMDGLARRLSTRLDAGADSLADRLTALYERERIARAQGAPSASATGARREQHALMAAGMPRWRAFAAALQQLRGRPLASLGEDGVSRFAASYRELTADLARLQTAARGREVEGLYYLNRLVAAGHNRLYRQSRMAPASVWRYLTHVVPREIRRSWRPIGAAALALFGPAAIAFVVTLREPALAHEFMSEGMIDRAENAADRARRNVGYIEVPEITQPLMASQIIANNVQVTYAAFGFGMTAGIGTLLLLVVNGISFGGFAGLYASMGVGSLLVAFVAPHGVLELSAIAIAGGGGLLIASALLLPGVLTRREAFARQGRRALDLLVASSVMLIVAGTIEGFVSPRVWPIEWKLAVSAATALAMVLGVAFLGRSVTPPRAP